MTRISCWGSPAAAAAGLPISAAHQAIRAATMRRVTLRYSGRSARPGPPPRSNEAWPARRPAPLRRDAAPHPRPALVDLRLDRPDGLHQMLLLGELTLAIGAGGQVLGDKLPVGGIELAGSVPRQQLLDPVVLTLSQSDGLG